MRNNTYLSPSANRHRTKREGKTKIQRERKRELRELIHSQFLGSQSEFEVPQAAINQRMPHKSLLAKNKATATTENLPRAGATNINL